MMEMDHHVLVRVNNPKEQEQRPNHFQVMDMEQLRLRDMVLLYLRSW
jgi:2-oxo-4-hydroxy-4-carboxy--5-ureidoimidazoline (OHCU) decarboxylase